MIEKETIIPENVTVDIDKKLVKVSGENGELEREFKYFFSIKIEKKDNKIIVSSDSERRKVKAMIGTIIAHINNMFKGVMQGFTYKMKVVYSHFPVTVKVDGSKVSINNFLGEKLPRVAKIVGDTKIDIKGQDITLTGTNKEEVAQTAGNMETATRITGKDRRVFMDGCFITEKG